ncbi:MAG: hypothetical protein N2444_00265 [Methylocystis sp.]|nr:hypothetical protein [Methylocystis sp.]
MPSPQDHLQSAGAVVAGASVSALLIGGTLGDRIIGGAVGGLFAAVAGPIFTPIFFSVIVDLYSQMGVDPTLVPADAIGPFTGFILGVFGIDLLSWAKDRVKGLLSALRFPGSKAPPE